MTSADLVLHEPSAMDVEITIVKLKSHKSPGIIQIPAGEFKVCGKEFSC